MIGIGSLVVFKELKNARGYPLTGEVIDHDDTHAIVKAWGLYGPGTETEVNNVPLTDLLEANTTEVLDCGCTVKKGWRCQWHGAP